MNMNQKRDNGEKKYLAIGEIDTPIEKVKVDGVEVQPEDRIVDLKLKDKFVSREELSEGIKSQRFEADSITVDGKNVSLEGHKHLASDVDFNDVELHLEGHTHDGYVKKEDLLNKLNSPTVTNIQQLVDALKELCQS